MRRTSRVFMSKVIWAATEVCLSCFGRRKQNIGRLSLVVFSEHYSISISRNFKHSFNFVLISQALILQNLFQSCWSHFKPSLYLFHSAYVLSECLLKILSLFWIFYPFSPLLFWVWQNLWCFRRLWKLFLSFS